jgi:hypothetical protein
MMVVDLAAGMANGEAPARCARFAVTTAGAQRKLLARAAAAG